ncbi:MAG: heme exporter protein CcmD, partial [Blastochloris sp.]|nr:heme exporter protein CcmD [Blastochloris sp.]
MIDLGPHALFIELAWGAAVVITFSLIGWVVVDHRAQRRQLTKLEAASEARRRPAAV